MTADSQTLPLDRISQDRRNAYKALAGSSTSVFDRFNRQQPPPQKSRFSLAESAIWDDASIMPDSPTETDIPEVPRIPSKYVQGQDWVGAITLSPSQSHQIPGAISLTLARGDTLTRAHTRLAGLVSITVDLPRSLKSQETQFTAPGNPTINSTRGSIIHQAQPLPHAVSAPRHL